MGIEYVRLKLGMPYLKVGMRVYVSNYRSYGRITSTSKNGNINVRLDGKQFVYECDPQCGIRYYNKKDDVIAEYGITIKRINHENSNEADKRQMTKDRNKYIRLYFR